MRLFRKRPAEKPINKLQNFLDEHGQLDIEKLQNDHWFKVGSSLAISITGFEVNIEYGKVYLEDSNLEQRRRIIFHGDVFLGNQFTRVNAQIVILDAKCKRGDFPAEICLADWNILEVGLDYPIFRFLIYDPGMWFQAELEKLLLTTKRVAYKPNVIFSIHKPTAWYTVELNEDESSTTHNRRCGVRFLTMNYSASL